MKIIIFQFALLFGLVIFQYGSLAVNKIKILKVSTSATVTTSKVYSTYGLPCSVSTPCISGSNLYCKNGTCR